MTGIDKELVMLFLAACSTVLWWLLRNKDAQQQKAIEGILKSIDLLFLKHDQDVKALSNLELQVAGEHYKRGELDMRFAKLEDTFRQEMRDLGNKVETLTAAILERNKKP